MDIYAPQAVLDNLTEFFLNGELYPQFHKKPEDKPTLKLHKLEALQRISVAGYDVLPIEMNHSIPTLGYQLTSSDGKILFYSGDTGPGLAGLWQNTSPQVLFIEVTASNKWVESASKSGHMTPGLLHQELTNFRKLKGYIPRVIAVHINPPDENDIRRELSEAARSLKADIRLACEDLVVEI